MKAAIQVNQTNVIAKAVQFVNTSRWILTMLFARVLCWSN